MPLTLSDAQLKDIANELFLLKNPRPSKLSRPTNTTEPPSFAAKLDYIVDPLTAPGKKFKDIGIGVVDFNGDPMHPKVWLHNEQHVWRVASTGKMAILLAAVQLRDDVKKVKATGLVSTTDEFDELFSMPKLWKLAKNDKSKLLLIGQKGNAPRISTIFDFNLPKLDFRGAPTSTPPTVDKTEIIDKFKVTVGRPTWTTKTKSGTVVPGSVPAYSFFELLWLTGAVSDDVAATACVSEIGIDYIMAVQRAYGLFDDDERKGMRLLLSEGYDPGDPTMTPVTTIHDTPKYRKIREKTPVQEVKDFFPGPGNSSHQGGSAAALTAYMIALMQDMLVEQPTVALRKEVCDAIRMFMADETGLFGASSPMQTSSVVEGVSSLAGAALTKARTKIGILRNDHISRTSGEGTLYCEFAYLEAEGLKYAVIVTGLFATSDGPPKELGIRIHQALKAP